MITKAAGGATVLGVRLRFTSKTVNNTVPYQCCVGTVVQLHVPLIRVRPVFCFVFQTTTTIAPRSVLTLVWSAIVVAPSSTRFFVLKLYFSGRHNHNFLFERNKGHMRPQFRKK
jgi:hypothetical protein